MKNKILAILVATLLMTCAAEAQIAQGGTYKLDQAVIASGGGTSASADNTFLLTGTIGQSIAGTTSTNLPFTVNGGFFTPPPFAPTAASVSVSGRILTPEGRGLRNVIVILTDMRGNTRTASSSTFGYYRFSEVEAGQTYIFTILSKHYQFTPQVVNVMEEIEGLDFVAYSPREK